MHRTIHRTILLAAAAALAACEGPAPTAAAGDIPEASSAGTTRPTTERASIHIHREGGFAGWVTDASVDSASGVFVLVTRNACRGVPCRPPIDSASGVLPRADVRALFDLVAARRIFSLKDSYGTSPNAADQYFYETTVRANGAEKKVYADDITLPQAMRDVHDAVFRSIDAARRR